MNPFAWAAHHKYLGIKVLSSRGPTWEQYVPWLIGETEANGRYGGERARWLECATCEVNFKQRSRSMKHRPSNLTERSPQLFETHNLALAAFLIAGRHLHYLRTRIEAGRATFVFEDQDGRGPKLEGEFVSGAECSATLYHSTVKRLRREIDQAIAGDGGQ